MRCRACSGKPINPTTASWCGLSWHQGGTVGATNFVTLDGKKFRQQADAEDATRSRAGRWVQIDQEVILNAAEQENGILRVWIDGALAVDKADIAYRVKPDIALSGVAADLFYNGDDGRIWPCTRRRQGHGCRPSRSAGRSAGSSLRAVSSDGIRARCAQSDLIPRSRQPPHGVGLIANHGLRAIKIRGCI